MREDPSRQIATVRLDQRTLVDDVVHRAADVDVVERRDGDVHGDRSQEISRVDFDAAQARVSADLVDQPRHDLRRRRSTKNDVGPSAIYEVCGIVIRDTDRDLYAIDISGPERIGDPSPRRIADKGQRPARPEAARRRLPLRPEGEVEGIAPFDHVWPGGDEKASITGVVSGRHAELRVRIAGQRGKRRGVRDCEAIWQIAGDLGEMHLQREWVRNLQPQDRSGAPIPVIVEPVDRREEVRAAVLDPSVALEGPHEVARRDRDVVEGRCVVSPGPEMECPDQPVDRHLGKLGSQVRLKVRPAVAVRMSGM